VSVSDITDYVLSSREGIDLRGAERRGEDSERGDSEKVEELDWGHFDGLCVRQEDGYVNDRE